MTFFGAGLTHKAKSARSEVFFKLAALLKEQCLGKRQGVMVMDYEKIMMKGVVGFDERSRRASEVGLEHLDVFNRARKMAEHMVMESKAETLEQIQTVWSNKLQTLLEVDATFELELGFLSHLVKDGAKQLLANEVLSHMPSQDHEQTLEESIAAVQALSGSAMARLVPEQSKGPLTVALQILTTMRSSMAVDVETLQHQPYMDEFCARLSLEMQS